MGHVQTLLYVFDADAVKSPCHIRLVCVVLYLIRLLHLFRFLRTKFRIGIGTVEL